MMFGYTLAEISGASGFTLLVILLFFYFRRHVRDKGPHDDFYGELEEGEQRRRQNKRIHL